MTGDRPGERGYHMSWYGHANPYTDMAALLRWRKKAAKDIRALAKKLKAPDGANFHDLLRLQVGEEAAEQPAEAKPAELEDRRLVAEFEWELSERHMGYPHTLDDLLQAVQTANSASGSPSE